MKKTRLGRAFLLLVCFLFLVSCCGTTKIINNIYGQERSPIHSKSVFLIVKKDFVSMGEDELLLISQSTGTGTSVYSSPTHSNILTAGHVCIDMLTEISTVSTFTVLDFHGKSIEAQFLAADLKSDLCLLQIKRETFPVQIADTEPQNGDVVFYAGYPLGLYMPNNLHHFRGYYSGSDPADFGMFSLAAAPGSSGSSIVNYRGEVVGVVSAIPEEFDSLTIGPTLARLKPFLAANSH